MRSALIFLYLILAATYPAVAQKPECPAIRGEGLERIVGLGEMVMYRAIISPEPATGAIGYKWRVIHYDAEKGATTDVPFFGQGTSQISFRLDFDSFTAKLEVTGLPTGCPNTVAVSASLTPRPNAVKLGGTEIKNFATLGRWMSDLAASNELPDSDQLLLHFVYPKTASNRAISGREAEVIAKIQRAFGVGQDRISVERKAGSRYVIELWRIPPGAEDPACEICRNK
jgi:hypothetical protein